MLGLELCKETQLRCPVRRLGPEFPRALTMAEASEFVAASTPGLEISTIFA